MPLRIYIYIGLYIHMLVSEFLLLPNIGISISPQRSIWVGLYSPAISLTASPNPPTLSKRLIFMTTSRVASKASTHSYILSLLDLQLQLGNLGLCQFTLNVKGPFEKANYGRLVEQRRQHLLEGERPIHLGSCVLTVVGAGGVRALRGAGGVFGWRLLFLRSRDAGGLRGLGRAPRHLEPPSHLFHPQEEAGNVGHSSVQRLLLWVGVKNVVQGLGELDELSLRNK